LTVEIGGAVAMFAVFAPHARIRRLGRVPVAARIEAGYGRSAARPVKAWAAACAVAGLVASGLIATEPRQP
jgi:2-methylisocitrate lyase-like PEP mutase family enzyme